MSLHVLYIKDFYQLNYQKKNLEFVLVTNIFKLTFLIKCYFAE